MDFLKNDRLSSSSQLEADSLSLTSATLKPDPYQVSIGVSDMLESQAEGPSLKW